MKTTLLLSMPGGGEWILILIVLFASIYFIYNLGYRMGIRQGENNILKQREKKE